MSDHQFLYINDEFHLTLTMKRDGDPDWVDAQIWGSMVQAVMETMRTPIALPMISDAQANEARESWTRKWRG